MVKFAEAQYRCVIAALVLRQATGVLLTQASGNGLGGCVPTDTPWTPSDATSMLTVLGR